MPRRIEVELTSSRDDGTWTWRAAGARQPKGELDGGLLPSGAKVGDVLRAEADFDIEGITVVAVDAAQAGPARARAARDHRAGPRRAARDHHARGQAGRGDDRAAGRDRVAATAPATAATRDRPRRGDAPPAAEGRARRAPRRAGRPPAASDRHGASVRPDRRGPSPSRDPRPSACGPVGCTATRCWPRCPRSRSPSPSRCCAAASPRSARPSTSRTSRPRRPARPRSRPTAWCRSPSSCSPACAPPSGTTGPTPRWPTSTRWRCTDLRSVVVAADRAARDEATRELAQQLRDALDPPGRAGARGLAGRDRPDPRRRAHRPGPAPQLAPAQGRRTPAPRPVVPVWPRRPAPSLTADTAPDRYATVLDALAYSPVRGVVVPQGVPGRTRRRPARRWSASSPSRLPQIATAFGIEPAPVHPDAPAAQARPRPPPRPEPPSRPSRPCRAEPSGVRADARAGRPSRAGGRAEPDRAERPSRSSEPDGGRWPSVRPSRSADGRRRLSRSERQPPARPAGPRGGPAPGRRPRPRPAGSSRPARSGPPPPARRPGRGPCRRRTRLVAASSPSASSTGPSRLEPVEGVAEQRHLGLPPQAGQLGAARPRDACSSRPPTGRAPATSSTTPGEGLGLVLVVGVQVVGHLDAQALALVGSSTWPKVTGRRVDARAPRRPRPAPRRSRAACRRDRTPGPVAIASVWPTTPRVQAHGRLRSPRSYRGAHDQPPRQEERGER